MPAGGNNNLIPGNERSQEELRKNGRKGGIQSGKSRRLAKTFREAINDNLTDDDIKNMIATLTKLAKKGNTKAFEILRDTRGEKPVEKQEVKEVTSEWFK